MILIEQNGNVRTLSRQQQQQQQLQLNSTFHILILKRMHERSVLLYRLDHYLRLLVNSMYFRSNIPFDLRCLRSEFILYSIFLVVRATLFRFSSQ